MRPSEVGSRDGFASLQLSCSDGLSAVGSSTTNPAMNDFTKSILRELFGPHTTASHQKAADTAQPLGPYVVQEVAHELGAGQ